MASVPMVQAVSVMTGLQSLGLNQCSSLSGDDVLAVLPHLASLTRLTLHAVHLSTEQICALAKVGLVFCFCPSVTYRCILVTFWSYSGLIWLLQMLRCFTLYKFALPVETVFLT